MELFKASNQWSTRPADERFPSLQALHAAVSGYRNDAREAQRPYRALSVGLQTVNGKDEPALIGPSGNPARFTNWSFGQLCARVGAPANYLRALPADLVKSNLNHGLVSLADDGEPNAKLLFHTNGSLLVTAFTSEKYTRIWNADVIKRLLALSERQPQWQPAPAAMDGSRGLYASDHDCFAFMVDNARRIREEAPDGGMSRGFFVWNSEVGAASFGIMTFLYRYVCENHIVWGASGVQELRIRHIGDADDRAFASLGAELRRYSDASESDERGKIEATMRYSLGNNKDEVLDRVFGLRIPVLSRKRADEAYQLAEANVDVDGSPRTAWGFAQGLTRLSQTVAYADERVSLDRAAGKVLQIAF